MKRLPNLDPLRFFLAAFVLLFHLQQLCKNQGLPYYNELPIFQRGSQAVYMFFVLSGFLIIRIIYLKKKTQTFSIRKFYMRRILRIFPLYFLIVAFGFIFYNAILPALNIPFEINYNLTEGIFLTVFFMPNIFAFGYHPGGILEVLWSIGIEEQFYLMIAPLSFIVRYKYLFSVLLVLTLVYFGVYHFSNFDFLRTYRFVYFFLTVGGVVAILEERKQLEFLKASSIFPILIVLFAVLSFTTDIFEFRAFWKRNLSMAVIFPLFIHTLAFNNKGLNIKNKLLTYLGTISYGIYMFHVIALNFVVFFFLKIDKLNIFNDVITIILINISTFVVAIIFAHLSYKYFESYFLKLKQKFRE